MFILVILSITFLLGAVGFCLAFKPSGDKAQPVSCALDGTHTRSPFVTYPAREVLGSQRLTLEWRLKANEPLEISDNQSSVAEDEDEAAKWHRYEMQSGWRVLAAAASGLSDCRYYGFLGPKGMEDEQQETDKTGLLIR